MASGSGIDVDETAYHRARIATVLKMAVQANPHLVRWLDAYNPAVLPGTKASREQINTVPGTSISDPMRLGSYDSALIVATRGATRRPEGAQLLVNAFDSLVDNAARAGMRQLQELRHEMSAASDLPSGDFLVPAVARALQTADTLLGQDRAPVPYGPWRGRVAAQEPTTPIHPIGNNDDGIFQ